MSQQSLALDTQLAVQPPGRERRIAVRYLPKPQTSCQMIVGLENRVWQATIRDLSECGIGLQLSQHLEPGTLLTLALHNPSQDLCRTLLAVVIYAMAEPGGEWLVGCQFASVLTKEELQALCER